MNIDKESSYRHIEQLVASHQSVPLFIIETLKFQTVRREKHI